MKLQLVVTALLQSLTSAAFAQSASAPRYLCDLKYGIMRTISVDGDKLDAFKDGLEKPISTCTRSGTIAVDGKSYDHYSKCTSDEDRPAQAMFISAEMQAQEPTADILVSFNGSDKPTGEIYHCAKADFRVKDLMQKISDSALGPNDLLNDDATISSLNRARRYYKVRAAQYLNLPGQSQKYYDFVYSYVTSEIEALPALPTKNQALNFLAQMTVANSEKSEPENYGSLTVKYYRYDWTNTMAFIKTLERDAKKYDLYEPMNDANLKEYTRARAFMLGILEQYGNTSVPSDPTFTKDYKLALLDISGVTHPTTLEGRNSLYVLSWELIDPMNGFGFGTLRRYFP